MTIIQELKAELAECARLRRAENRMTAEQVERARKLDADRKAAEARVEALEREVKRLEGELAVEKQRYQSLMDSVAYDRD